MAYAEVVTANAKPATANNLSIVFLLFTLTHALWRVAPNMDQYHCSVERWLNDRSTPSSTIDVITCSPHGGWPMSSLDKMLEWLPHISREWIELIIVTVLLWLLMMAIFELELGS
jgi:hypothetical protein